MTRTDTPAVHFPEAISHAGLTIHLNPFSELSMYE